VVQTSPGTGYFRDFVPGGIYGQGGKWQGNGIDIFVRDNAPIYAPTSGRVWATNVPAPGSPTGSIPTTYLQTNDGTVLQFGHIRGTKSGQVSAGTEIGRANDPNLRPGWQHADLVINPMGPFQGRTDARQWLQSIGANLRAIPGRTLGPMEMMQGASPFGASGGQSVPSSLLPSGFGGGFGLGGQTGTSFGLLGLRNQDIGGNGDPTQQPLLGTLGMGLPDQGGAAPSGADPSAMGTVGGTLDSLTQSSGQTLSERIPFENPLAGIPEQWASAAPYIIAALVATSGVAFVQYTESTGGHRSVSWILMVLIVLGVLIIREMADGGTPADAIVGLIEKLSSTLQSGMGASAGEPPLGGTTSGARPSRPIPTRTNNAASSPITQMTNARISPEGYAFPVQSFRGQIESHGEWSGGMDIFAPPGSPIVAMRGGVVELVSSGDAIGGNSVQILGNDGLRYYYSHLQRPSGLRQGQPVQTGQEVGFVGTTGNAAGTRPHLHLGIGEQIYTNRAVRDTRGGTGGVFPRAQQLLNNAYNWLVNQR
jgi:murein DD-endopeptidase MepM/ murein hydrolase activator NlpD